jgi:hypothetical protein
MQYDALTIDTQTVFYSGFRFETGLLAQLRQFKEGPTKVVLAKVVQREILKHLVQRTEEAHQALQTGLKRAAECGLPSDMAGAGHADPKAVARTRLQGFIDGTSAVIVDYDAVKLTDLMERYFKPAPPFAAVGKKKNEFPDAVALLSLETWAAANNKRILAATDDADWAAFAKTSSYIDVVSNLGDALAQLQQDTERARQIVSELLALIEAPDGALREEFEQALKIATPGYVPYGEAESYYHVDVDQVDLAYNAFELKGAPGEPEFDVVQARPDHLVARVALTMRVRAEGTFSFSAWDSIDKDYVGLGSSSAEVDVDLDARALVTFDREEADAWTISEIELVEDWDTVNFGYVEPDYSREWEEEP